MTRDDDKPIGDTDTLADDQVPLAATVPSDARAQAEMAATAPGDAQAQAEMAATVPSGAGQEVTLPPPGQPLKVHTGERFGAFQVLQKLGAGGMGEVFAAYDPDLDRKVAIKVLRRDAGGREAQTRLLREAQAMAQLSHPNVITVHQVGTRDERVFVVMEYVDGGTLRDWLDASTRPWREVLATLTSAARGLAAAHRAGLVHRDFKPDNVLIGADGRVLVTDFGLVATVAAEAGSPPSAETEPPDPRLTPSSSKLAVELTRPGAVMGTPLYMAPEQHRGERVDARADQFAFCVALFEALYGERPFGGTTYREVVDSVLQGVPRPAPAESDVPGWLYEVVTRGLRTNRDERYPDMEALLEALGRDPSVRRRKLWLAAGAATVVLGLAALALLLWPGDRCRSAGDKLAQVWNDGQRSALRAAWPRGDRDQLERIIAGLDRYGAAWAGERVAACRATFVEGEQSEQLLDRRMMCLDSRLEEMRALVDRLRAPSAAVAQAAAVAVTRLPRFGECNDRAALSELAPPPARAREEVAATLAQVNRAHARTSLGELDAAQKTAAAALERAKRIGYPPLVARAHYVAGFVAGRRGQHDRAEREMREAIRQAARSRAHYVEAEAWLSLIYLVGHETDRPDPALAMAAAAEAAVARAAGNAALRGRLEGNLGLILMSKGDYRKARTRLERSLQIFIKAFGENDLDTAIARNNLAMLLERLGEHRAAYRQLERVLAVRRRLLGTKHPAVATALNDMGNSAHSLGELARAREQLERALAIREAALGEHPRTAHTLNNLAIVLGDMGQPELAAKHARRAVAIAERAFGASHPELAGPLNTLGNQLRELGQTKPAWEAYARGLAIIEHAKGRDHIGVAPLVENLARLLVQLGDPDRAIAFVNRALAVRQRAQGPTHEMTINALALRGSFNLQAKRPDAAAKDFELQDSLAVKAFGESHVEVALARYNLAVALEQAGKLADADARYRATLAIFERAAPKHRFVANAWRGLGDVAVARGELEAGEKHYERAVAAAEAAGHSALGDLLHLLGVTRARRKHYDRAADALKRAVEVRRKQGDRALLALDTFELAKVLWAGGLDRAGALTHARQARQLFVAVGERASDNVAEVDAWLRRRAR